MLNTSLGEVEKQGLKIDVVVADGDACTKKLLKAKGIEVNSDVRHKSSNIVKRVKKAKIDYNGLPGKNKTEKKREFDLFVASVMQRCNAENKYASLKSKGSGIGKLNSVKAKLKGVKEAVLACHTGNCGTLCKISSNVCDGYEYPDRPERKYVKHGPIIKNISEHNKSIIMGMIKERLEENINVTYRNAGTNIVEAFNRTYVKSCPKVSAFSKNWKNRHHKSVILINEGTVEGTKLVRDTIGLKKIPASVIHRQRHNQRRRQKQRLWNICLKKKIRFQARTTFLQNLYRQKRHSRTYGKGIDWK